MQSNFTKTVLFLINGFGVASKDSFDINFNNTMPNLSMIMGNYLYSTLENINYNYKNGYRNFSLGNDLLPTYHRLESDTNFGNNKTILNIAADAINNKTKVQVFCFLDNESVINQVIKIIDVLKTKGDFPIFIHLILRQKDCVDYDKILNMIKKIEERITLYKNVEIGMIAGERVVNKEEYYYLFSKEYGEKWPDYTRKINYSVTKQIPPRQLDPFYIHPGFKLQNNDISLFLNYEDVDCNEFITKLRNVKLYTLFPMKSFSYAINIYEELEPLDYLSKKLEKFNLNCLVLTTEDRMTSISYSLNGLKETNSNHIKYININDKNLDIDNILKQPYHLIIFDYDLEGFKEIAKLKDFLMELDDKINDIYNICNQNDYNLFISSLYGIFKEDYLVGVDKLVKLDYSLEVPVIMIDQNYPASKYFLKYGTTYNLCNTIINSITKDESVPSLIRKKGFLSYFKD